MSNTISSHKLSSCCSHNSTVCSDGSVGGNEHLHDVHHFSAEAVAVRVQSAREHCQKVGVRFTSLRQQVYELVLESEKPLGAYDLIARLQEVRQEDKAVIKAKNVAPPTIYRSLEFLLSEGLIHQLTSINAYVPCCHPRSQHVAAFLICEQCQRVQECSSLPVQDMMVFTQENAGFQVSRSVIELLGLCQRCR